MIIRKPKSHCYDSNNNTSNNINDSETNYDIINKETSGTISSVFRIQALIIIITLCVCLFIIFKLVAINYAQSGIIESIPFNDTEYVNQLKTSINASFVLIKHSYYSQLATILVICINICIICECIKSNANCIKKLNNNLNKTNSDKTDTEN